MESPVSNRLLDTGLVQDPGAVPLVLAVAGHRDPRPEDIQELRNKFRTLLTSLTEQLPHTPLVLLNGLAAGMDSEAAEVFLEVIHQQRQLYPQGPQHQLVAALPKPQHLYISEDFSDRGSEETKAERARLLRLLSACDAVLDGDNCPDLELTDSAKVDRDPWDPRCYGKQGIFLVRYCHVLVAFFNGIDSGKVGGTGQTRAMQLGEVYPLYVQVDEVISAREPGVVVEITTPRSSDRVRPCPVGAVRYWGENMDGGRIDSDGIAGLELPDLETLIKKSRVIKILEDLNAALPGFPPAEDSEAGMQSSLWRYANRRAVEEQSKYQLYCRVVMLLSVLISLATSQKEWQALGLMIVLAAVVIFPKLQRSPKLAFIQWRCLAECLMVTDRWRAAQIKIDTADLLHSQTNQNFVWIRTVLRARSLQLMAQLQKPSLRPPVPEAIDACRKWIAGQEQWLQATITKQMHWDRRLLIAGSSSFVLAFLLGIAFWIPIVSQNIPGFWAEFLIGVAAACFGYRELMGYGDTNARYGRSHAQFVRALRALSLARPDPKAPEMLVYRQQLVVEAVGREKIDELNDWVGDQLQRVYSPAG